jgi:hypothetical protein
MTPTPEEMEKVAEEMRKLSRLLRDGNLPSASLLPEWLDERASRLSPPKERRWMWWVNEESFFEVAAANCLRRIRSVYRYDSTPEEGMIPVRIIPADRFAALEKAIAEIDGEIHPSGFCSTPSGCAGCRLRTAWTKLTEGGGE